MLRTRRAVGSAAALAVAGLVITACGSSSSGSGSNGGSGGTPPTSTSAYSKISQNGSLDGAVKGGVLNVVGAGDVDYMDPNLVYYTVGSQAARLYARQLYTYPGVPGQTTSVVPDIATGMPTITDAGKTYTITIKQGVKWDTSPPRQVTAADFIRGVEITCNPGENAFGGQGDFNKLIVGYEQFCGHPAVQASPAKNGQPAVQAQPATGFASAPATVSGIKAYLKNHSISGITTGSTPETIVIHLTHPATFFTNELGGLTSLSPRAEEMLNYLPGSAEEAQHTISDGPYKIASYQPTKSIDFVRNPAWDPSTDTVRHAFVNEIKVTELGTGTTVATQVEQQVLTGRADLQWDVAVPATDANQLINKNEPLLNVQSEISSNPYLVWNTQSPNNKGALAKVAVRQALETAINRAYLIQDAGGTKLEVPLTHVLPPEIDGAPTSTSWPFAWDVNKAKQMLAAAGASHLTIKFLYRPSSQTSSAMFQDIQNQLQKVGVTVKGVQASNADFYVKYLEKPTSATSGAWDVSLAGWGPDWYTNSALSFFEPLFDGRVLPPSSSNFGLFNDKTVNSLIDAAATAPDLATAKADWAKADDQVIQDAAIYPIGDPNWPLVHASSVHNDVYIPSLQAFDLANVWLSS